MFGFTNNKPERQGADTSRANALRAKVCDENGESVELLPFEKPFYGDVGQSPSGAKPESSEPRALLLVNADEGLAVRSANVVANWVIRHSERSKESIKIHIAKSASFT